LQQWPGCAPCRIAQSGARLPVTVRYTSIALALSDGGTLTEIIFRRVSV
jgi:hypothetical protein